jgi:hypothetical protein
MAKDKTTQPSTGDSRSPLSARRGNADPVDIDDSKLNLDFGPRGYEDNPRQPLPPIEPGGALPPQESPKGGS